MAIADGRHHILAPGAEHRLPERVGKEQDVQSLAHGGFSSMRFEPRRSCPPWVACAGGRNGSSNLWAAQTARGRPSEKAYQKRIPVSNGALFRQEDNFEESRSDGLE